jgi:endonuclease/exonuclease/phosphatase (EEP) superfamily protein YafD
MGRLIALAILAAAQPAAADPPRVLRVMTYNIEYNNPTPKHSLDAIADADADVVLLQEVSTEWAHALDARFAKQYPYRAFHTETRGSPGEAVLSKLPIESDALLRPPAGGWLTWHQDPLRFDLDCVMIDARLAASAGKVLDAGTSDHRPVFVTISRRMAGK